MNFVPMSDLNHMPTLIDESKLRAANKVWQEYGRVDRTTMYEKIESIEHMLGVMLVMIEECKKIVDQIKDL